MKNPFSDIRDKYLEKAASGCTEGVKDQITPKSSEEAVSFVMSLLDARDKTNYIKGDYVEVIRSSLLKDGYAQHRVFHTALYSSDRNEAEATVRDIFTTSKSVAIRLVIGDSDKRGRVVLEFEIKEED